MIKNKKLALKGIGLSNSIDFINMEAWNKLVRESYDDIRNNRVSKIKKKFYTKLIPKEYCLDLANYSALVGNHELVNFFTKSNFGEAEFNEIAKAAASEGHWEIVLDMVKRGANNSKEIEKIALKYEHFQP